MQTRRVDEIALSILKEQVRFVVPPKSGSDKNKHRWPVWQPWEWFLKDVSQLKLSIEPKEKSLEQLYGWLSLSVAPSLWVVRELDRMCGTRQLNRLIDNANVTEKHRKMLENYLKQMERLKIHKYRLEERELLEYYE